MALFAHPKKVDPLAPFKFEGLMMFHPMNVAWGVSYNQVVAEIFLVTPFGHSASFELATFQPDRWTRLVDEAGRRAPIEILVSDTGVFGRWL